MIDLKTGVNAVGILVSMVGVLVVYVNSPLNISAIDGGDASTDFNKIERRTLRRNRGMRTGVWVIILGSLVQLISNFIPESTC